MAAGIKVVPSAARVSPGETFSVDVVAEGIPSEGLGTVQFRLNVNAAGGSIAGVSDLIQAKSGDISVSTPLQISAPTSTRSGLGDFFWNGRSSHGVLVMDNEPLNNGSALYTYAHTNGAALPVGSGTVARFQFAVGSAVEAENINISLSDVMLLDGGTEYPLEYNNGATVQLRCMTTTPSLLGLTLSEAKTALEGANLTLGNVYEISNNGSRSLNAVLEQSSQSGTSLLCQTPVDLAINTAPTDVTQAIAADKAGDDTGGIILSWLPSSSADIAGYKVYSSSTLLKTINAPSAAGTEIGGLTNGTITQLKVTAYDTYGNESQGVTIQATALDDVPPVITVEGVQEGSYYSTDVTPVVNVFDNHLSTKTVTLNNTAYNGTAITSEGSYTLSIAAADLSGNLSSKTVNFAVDKTPPAITITGVEEGRYYNTDLSPVVNVSDTNLKEKTVTLNGQPYNGASITAEGSYTLAINAVDMVGHASSETRNFHIDKTAPVSVNAIGSPKVEEGGSIFVTGSTPVTLSASDSGTVSSGVNRTEYSIDSAATWNIYGNGISLSSAFDGLHSISYKSADNATNIETAKQISVTVDNGAPVTAVTVGEPKFQAQDGSFLITQGTAFTLSASDAYSGVSRTEYRLNNGQWTAYAPFNLSNEGAYHIEYRSADKLENIETSKSLNAIVDNTPPVSNLTLGTPKHEANGSIYISGSTSFTLISSDNLSGIRGIEYRVDGGQWTEYTAAFNLSTLSDGQHAIHYRASDNVGNIESEKTLAFVIDNTPPETAITVSVPKFTSDGGLYVTKDTEFTLSSSDNLSGVSRVEYRIDSGAWTEYRAFKISSEGSHVIGFRSTDNLGNIETEKTLSVTVDNTPPVSSITTGEPRHTASDGTLFVTASTVFTLTATDSLSGVKSTEYRVDSGTWTAYASPFSIPAEGSRLIEYRSLDNVGNLETIKSVSVTVDNTPPVTGITVGTPKHEANGAIYVTLATQFTLSSTDNLSGVNRTEYRIDGGEWTGYAGAFNLTSLPDGQHSVGYRSVDNLGNMETEKILSIIIDNTPPVTDIHVSEPKFSVGGNLFVTMDTEFTLTSGDNLSGIAKTEYRIDGGQWTVYAPFKIATEGNHTIEYRSTDNVGNAEAVRTLGIIVDNTPPSTGITVGTPKYTSSNGAIYVTGATTFTLSASDNLSGVKVTEYRVDGGAWTAYAPFSISNEGRHLIEYRSTDNVGNTEQIRSLKVTVDNTPPVTSITSGSPKYETENTLYVAGKTVFTLSATDNLSGVKDTEYRVDNSSWVTGTSLSVPDEGNRTIAYRSRDNVENVETEKSINIIVDNTPPVTTVDFNQQKYTDGQNILISKNTQVILTSTDNLSGVKGTYYRFNDEDSWRTYTGAFRLTELTFGTHTVRYRSADNVENAEAEKSITVILVGIDVKTDVMNLPRVLVWTRDPSKATGNNKPTYTLDNIKGFISGALNDKDIYFKMTTDKDEFLKEFRSGIYNMTAVIDQDTPFDAIFLREMREAVKRGMGLLISGWGNTTPPILEEALGVQVSGSLSTNDSDRTIYLYQSPVSPERSLAAKGKILKASLTTGTLAGIVKGEEVCDGIRGVSLRYQTALNTGDAVKASLYTASGKKLVLLDEEVLYIDTLPSSGINAYTWSASEDISIDGASPDGATVSLKMPSGYLGGTYYISLSVQRQGGEIASTGPVKVTPTCSANLKPGVAITPFAVVDVQADTHKTADDLPAVVLNNYGKGKAVFVSFDIIESALNRNIVEYAWIMKSAMNYILPQEAKPEAAGISLLETKVKLHGTGMDLKAVDTLGEGLTHLPLFSLTRTPLEYTFYLVDGEETSYRYFVRVKDKVGTYGKDTDIYLGINGGYSLFDKYRYNVVIDVDSDLLMKQAVAWVNEQLSAHPESTDSLNTILNELVTIAFMPRLTEADVDKVIHQVVQTIHHINQLPFDTAKGREIMDGYLRMMEGYI